MKLFIIFLILIVNITIGASQNVYQDIELYFKNQNSDPNGEIFNVLLSSNSLDAFYAINRFTTDSSVNVRQDAYKLLGFLGQRTANEEVRSRCAKQLVIGMRDKDSGIVGNVIDLLTSFGVKDFDKESLRELITLLNEKIPHYDRLVKLVGYLKIEESVSPMKQLLSEGKCTNNIRWSLYLALARIGDEDAIDYCMRKVKSAKVNSNLVYEVFPDLVYIRQKEAFNYLFDIIQSDSKDCSSPNPDSDVKIICAYRVIGLVAPYIVDFPVKSDQYGGISTDITAEVQTKVRNWIASNREAYLLITNKY